MINYHYFDSLPSTQSYVKEHIAEFDLSQMTCVYAGKQTSGLGTRGKKWYSPNARNIYATIVFSIPLHIKNFYNLAQIISLSAAKKLSSHGVEANLRWPNDLIINQKKVGGVLVEVTPYEKHHTVILGFGLNVNMPEEELALVDQPATSMAFELGELFDEKKLLCEIAEQFLDDLEQYLEHGFEPFYNDYCERMNYIDTPIAFQSGKEKKRGKVSGIDRDGQLIVTLENGTQTTVSSGTLTHLF